MAFMAGAGRFIKTELNTQLRFVRLGAEVRDYLTACMKWADLDANLDYDMEAFSRLVMFDIDPTPPEKLYALGAQLIEAGIFVPYEVRGHTYVSIPEMNTPYSALYQEKPRGKNPPKWRNPTPENPDGMFIPPSVQIKEISTDERDGSGVPDQLHGEGRRQVDAAASQRVPASVSSRSEERRRVADGVSVREHGFAVADQGSRDRRGSDEGTSGEGDQPSRRRTTRGVRKSAASKELTHQLTGGLEDANEEERDTSGIQSVEDTDGDDGEAVPGVQVGGRGARSRVPGRKRDAEVLRVQGDDAPDGKAGKRLKRGIKKSATPQALAALQKPAKPLEEAHPRTTKQLRDKLALLRSQRPQEVSTPPRDAKKRRTLGKPEGEERITKMRERSKRLNSETEDTEYCGDHGYWKNHCAMCRLQQRFAA